MIKIGIDPDIDKSGFALSHEKNIELTTYSIPNLLKRIRELKQDNGPENIKIFIEFGELNKSNFHIKFIPSGVRDIKAYCAQIGANTGKNFATAKLLYDLITSEQISCVKVRPVTRKLDSKTFKALTKINKRTNQEERDAFMLIFGR